ncbi:MAG: hypothetical protein AMJ66_01110 [Betaproteobacteria bacterium SG8_40]|nr:MAG: hypothetical protein AMJ66_01110 [Betaproteobacteria bacterium SG8_40]
MFLEAKSSIVARCTRAGNALGMHVVPDQKKPATWVAGKVVRARLLLWTGVALHLSGLLGNIVWFCSGADPALDDLIVARCAVLERIDQGEMRDVLAIAPGRGGRRCCIQVGMRRRFRRRMSHGCSLPLHFSLLIMLTRAVWFACRFE